MRFHRFDRVRAGNPMVTATPNAAKAQASAPPMIPPAAQGVASSIGAPLFVAADPDLVAKEGVAQDSWFVVSHLTSGSNRPLGSLYPADTTPGWPRDTGDRIRVGSC